MYEEIFDEVRKELEYANQKWGDEFDSKNTLNDWAAYTTIYMSQALRMDAEIDQIDANLRKAIGLLVNALRASRLGTLAKRHYD